MIILGVTHPISWNPAAALLADGELIAMAEEERFNRFKYSPRIPPDKSVAYCLDQAGLSLGDVDLFAVGWENALGQKRRKRCSWDFLAGRLPFDRKSDRVRWVRHHMAHAASSFFPSPFEEANVISLDAYGGSESGALGSASGADIRLTHKIPTAESWGYFYGEITKQLGFRFHMDEGKVMGLAAFGKARLDGVDFVSWNGLPGLDRKKFKAFLARAPRREPGAEITPEHKDLAATAQAVLESAVSGMARFLHGKTGFRNFCLSGGAALNCSANGALLCLDFVDSLFVNPAAHDAGTALGAALWVHREETGQRPPFRLTHPFFGPSYTDREIEKALEEAGVSSFRRVEDPAEEGARLLSLGRIVGWFQGRMEFGPRALGGRSILADPREASMALKVNDLKGRERWRPLAPSLLSEEQAGLLEREVDSPFMLISVKGKKGAADEIPAAMHVDGSMRHQTVGENAPPLFRRLLEKFRGNTGCPGVLNTSFNLRGQPIVCSPVHAISTFFSSGLDDLLIGGFHVTKG